MSYDVIGDVHGQADELSALLRRLGYAESRGAFRHPTRTAVFVGDFIDRGPKELETLGIARRMVAGGAALAVMGNHELNAIAWHTPDPERPGEYLRPRSGRKGEKNRRQHERFLAEVGEGSDLHGELVGWFKTLPLWLDLPGLRVVHACWHQAFMDYLEPLLSPGRRLGDDLLGPATREPEDEAEKDTAEPTPFKAAEALTKGIEVPLPAGFRFRDKDGHERHRARVKWWDGTASTFRDAVMEPDGLVTGLPGDPLPAHARIAPPDDRPVFFGHYWMTGTPVLAGPRVACVDYSAGNGGPLCAYRWEGERDLCADRFVLSR